MNLFRAIGIHPPNRHLFTSADFISVETEAELNTRDEEDICSVSKNFKPCLKASSAAAITGSQYKDHPAQG
jgi:hypothetical protein